MSARRNRVRSGPADTHRFASTWATRSRRPGRAKVHLLIAIVALIAGAVGGFSVSNWLPAPGPVSPDGSSAAGDEEQWYTCGMHPNVLQKGPGECPICHMKLTPLKKRTDEGDGGAAGGPQERKILYWRAPMDPNYIWDKPGKSPMGMDLVPVYADAEESPSAHTIRIDPVTVQNMGIRTTAIKRGPLVKTIRTVGRVDYDEQLVTFVDTKFNGWIEQLHVDETGQQVEEGQPLFDVYSRELYAAQEEYLAAIANLPRLSESTFAPAREEAAKLVEAAETKLKYMDVSVEQIDRLREAKKTEKTLSIHSPARGIVTEKMALEGMYVKPGMRLYTIADLSRIWVYVDVYEYQLPWIHVGQKAVVTLPYIPGQQFLGKAVYIYPYLEEQTRVIKVRLEFENPVLQLKPGMYANVRLESQLGRSVLLIPREAYIDSGTRMVAFVDLGNGRFSPRDIQVGVEAEDGMVEVLYGLDEGEVVVTSGQFLLDAESKLKEAVAKMMEAERAKTTKRPPMSGLTTEHGHHHEDSGSERTQPAAVMPHDAKYACPMEEHSDQADPAERGPYFSPEPGRCPRCGMDLKPLEELQWVQARLASKGGDVAYTCPDHPHVFSGQTAQCPRCGKELEPFKVMYTCPDPEHAGVVRTAGGNCPHCGRGLAAFKGIWLDRTMAEANVPSNPAVAEVARFRCPVHPLVHSDREGNCTICGRALEEAVPGGPSQAPKLVPADARFTCPMQECWHFSPDQGECPKCGMQLKPIEDIPWAKEARAAEPSRATEPVYVCPMHPEEVRAARPGTCFICGMQLVDQNAFKRPVAAPEHVAAQMDYIMEHYLELQRRLASDRTGDIALHALGLTSAAEELGKHLGDPAVEVPDAVRVAAEQLRTAALQTRGTNLESDRVEFVDVSAAVRTLVTHLRPDRARWPKLYIFHCPMTKGDWLQATEDKANPYYGFKMLKCGELQDIR